MEEKSNSTFDLYQDFFQEKKSFVSGNLFGKSYLNDSYSKYIIIINI